MSGIDFASAQKQALLAAANAQSIADGEKVGRRDKPSTLGVNPVCKVVAYIRNVRQGTDAAANYLASGDVDEDTELYRAVDCASSAAASFLSTLSPATFLSSSMATVLR